jgi:hypothetical protein
MDEQLTAAYAAEESLVKRVGRIRARRAGVTFLHVRRRVRDLIDSGEITAGMSHEQMANIVLDDLSAGNPRAFDDVPQRDWQAFFDFILKILPIILAIFGL